MTLDARLSSAARALESLPTSRVDIRVVRRRSRRRRFVASVVVVALAAVGVGLLRTNGGDASRSIYAGPDSGTAVEFHGLTVDLPPTWKVVEQECPGQDRTMLVGGESESAVCAVPDPGAAWLWLRPIDDLSVDELRSCTPGFVNDLPICQLIDPSTQVETLLVDGLDVALVRHTTPRRTDFASDFPYHYTDSERPEAQGSGGPRSLGTGYQLEQPLQVARDGVQAYLDGDCNRLRALADRTYDGGCPSGTPGATVGGSQLTSAGGAVTVEGARVSAAPGLAFDVEMHHEWSRATKRGVWRVASITPVDPSTPIPSATRDLPTCIGVVDHSGRNVGCSRKEDLYPATPVGPPAPRTTDAGTPVYASESSDEVVGYIGEIGFVPIALLPRYAELKACNDESLALLQGQSSTPLSATCRDLLIAQGVPEANLP